MLIQVQEMRQKGFTLVEILVTLAVGTVIIFGAMLTIQQIIVGSGRTSSGVMAAADVNQASLAIKKDLQMTESTNLTDGDPVPQSSVLFTWTNYTTFESDNSTDHASEYVLSGTRLMRTYDGETGIAGRYVTDVGFTQEGRVINVVITSTGTRFPPRSVTLRFCVQLRKEEVEE